MKSIIERKATFENNSDMEVKVTQKKVSQAFVKETQWSKTCSTVISTWQAKHQGKCPCARYVCPILNLCDSNVTCWLHSPLVQSNAACSQFQNSSGVATALVPEYVWVICNPNEEQLS